MRMNAMIPLAGQQPDFAQSYNQGYQLGRQNVFNTLAEQYGAKAMEGDKEALNAFASFDPKVGMGLAATRQDMDVQQERLGMARAEAARAAERHAMQMSAADRAAQAERIGKGLATVVPAMQSGNLEAVNQQLRTFGIDPVGSIGEAQLLVAQYDGAYQAYTRLDAMKPEAPKPMSGMGKFYADQGAGFIPAGTEYQGPGTNVSIDMGQDQDRYLYGNEAGLDKGWRYDRQTGRAEPIPGGPADREVAAGEEANANRAENEAAGAVNVLGVVQDLKREIEANPTMTTGFVGSLVRGLPGTSAYNAEATAQTIKANLAFDALAAMRKASPTGGALGAVSERELALLESQIANLDMNQSTERVLSSLESIEQQYMRLLKKAYETGDPAALDAALGGRPSFLTEGEAQIDGYTIREVE